MTKTKEYKQKKSTKSWQLSAFQRSLSKWLKVIFWKYEEVKEKVTQLEKRIEKLEKTVKLIRKKSKDIKSD